MPSRVLLTCPRCADLNELEAAHCENCGARLGLGLVNAADLELARRLRGLAPGEELRITSRELVALSRAIAEPLSRPTGRDGQRLRRARHKVERAAALLEERGGP